MRGETVVVQKRNKTKLRIIPLGGLGEIGKNMTVFEYENDIIVIDCGLAFPADEMLGIDLVIPDVSYLTKNSYKVRGIILTHGHEDHIGALPYILQELNVPIYGTKLTIGLVENKLKEHNLLKTTTLETVSQGETLKLGTNFKVEFINSNHSVADAVMLSIWSPAGIIVHTGDFKIDYTPIRGEMLNIHRLAELGKKGVLALMADSTNAERAGYTQSEKTVGTTLEDIFNRSIDRRIMVATFASNVDRVQQIINMAEKFKRKVLIIGRSMVNVVKTASELGYMDIPKNIMIDTSELRNYTDGQIVIIMTGSQGEPMAALSRMSKSEHRQLDIKPGDIVILSSTPIPGNEKTISNVVNDLSRKGAIVINQDTHVSGHAAQEELKLVQALVRPKYFIPVHGEYKHLLKHVELALSMGMPKQNTKILSIGDVLEISKDTFKVVGTVPAGQVLVDGLGVGDVGNIVLRDRKHLSQDGLLIAVMTLERETGMVVSGPDIISRGFVYVREAENLIDEAKKIVRRSLEHCENANICEWTQIKTIVKDDLKDFVWHKTKRSPMILPIIMEI
ncbi:ribonuclease J [Candidatus Epulonipiscium fishelsonii]|uniref:Ribonuclease J n=1 Tax=Candidatus Epulonipiscium fishelsonii TaxID=77094 RepID=A0ACC8XE54_9FIRM|nr:ribonuclease J [Epulopiscium sp. SCG-B11WGA-EpuloA1]ONI43805.1 ribonuclease J [Epulopiscium sp. SCG-B05WGA-EpuloA1]